MAFSLAYGPLTMAAAEGVDEEEHGLAGGLLYVSIRFGMALGISLVTAIAVALASDGVNMAGIRACLLVSLAVAVAAVLVTAVGLRRPAKSAMSSATGLPRRSRNC